MSQESAEIRPAQRVRGGSSATWLERAAAPGPILVLVAFVSLCSVLLARHLHDQEEQIVTLTRLRGEILHLDEVLTMSTHMAAATGDRAWIRRYDEHIGELDRAIREFLAASPVAVGRRLGQETNEANQRLVAAEARAIHAIEAGDREAARAILDADEYLADKRAYAAGMTRAHEATLDRRRANADILHALLLATGLLAFLACVGLWYAHGRQTRMATLLAERERDLGRLAAEREFRHVLEVARDATEEAGQVKTLFLAHMSDELRTPLGVILAHLDEAANGDDDARRDALRTIETNTRELATVLDGILDFSRAQAGALSVERQPTAVWRILADVYERARPAALEKGLSLDIRFATLLPRSIDTDPSRVHQVVSELVANAIRFTQHGSVRVLVRHDGAGKPVVIRVSDTGPGMSEETLLRAFEPLTAAGRSNARTTRGLGVGLRLCRDLATLMGGALTVDSVPGRGTSIELTLPCTASDDRIDAARWYRERPRPHAEAQNPEPPVASEDPLHGARILYAEDREDNRRIVARFLERVGAEVVFAENGALAIDAYRSGRFDLVLMDMAMPEVDGYEATRTLRAEGAEVPIVALTAHSLDGDRERCIASGCDDYLTKPVQFNALLATCRRALGGSVDCRDAGS
jgi:signal transduction histidine kinase/ActR/RegA family two-component response regulator